MKTLYFYQKKNIFIFITLLFLSSYHIYTSIQYFDQVSFIKLRSSTKLTISLCDVAESDFIGYLLEKNSLRYWLKLMEKYEELALRETDDSLKKKYKKKGEKAFERSVGLVKKQAKSNEKYSEILKTLNECANSVSPIYKPESILIRRKSMLSNVDYY